MLQLIFFAIALVFYPPITKIVKFTRENRIKQFRFYPLQK